MKKYGFYIITGIFIFMTIFFSTATVRGEGKKRLQGEDPYYREMEETYMKQVREKLTNMGYENAGVYMSRIVETDGSMEYTVHIHHRRIDKMSEIQKEELERQLEQIEFSDCTAKIYRKFIEYKC